MNVLDARTQSHQLRKSEDYEVVINEQGANLTTPEPVQGQAFYSGGDAPRKEYTGTVMERTGEALEDLSQATGSMAVGTAAGVAGFLGDAGSLIGGLASALFPGDKSRMEAAIETMSKISETIGSERFLGLYRDFVNNADLSQSDKQMMLDAAETGSFLSIPGVGATAAVGKDAIKEGVVKAGQAADARIADRAADTGVTLTAGADPMPAIDKGLSAMGRAFDDAQARYFEQGKFEPPTAENPVSIVKPTEDKPGIIAFHGSGADFDEFRLEMIGTGEGAQAFGYGLYFTDSEDIAKFYRDTMEHRDAMFGNLPIRYQGKKFADFEDSAAAEADPDKYRMVNALGKEIHRLSYSPKLRTPKNAKKQLLARLDNEIAQQRNAFKNQPADIKDAMEEAFIASLQRDKDALERIDINDITIQKTGKMYKVGLAPKPDELLDYDLPLSQQPKFAEALKPLYEEYGVAETADIGTLFETIKNQRGISAESLSDRLSKAGIPGIKYRSAVSRYNPKILVNGEKFESKDKLEEIAIHTLALRNNRIAGVMQSVKDEKLNKGDKNKVVQIAQKFLDDGKKATFEIKRNYVIFDDKAVKILEKYGIVGPVAVTAAGVSQTNTEAADGQDT